eukprot:SAG31_NODE_38671_length_294_cov_1.051282_1_plen_22_part_10
MFKMYRTMPPGQYGVRSTRARR